LLYHVSYVTINETLANVTEQKVSGDVSINFSIVE